MSKLEFPKFMEDVLIERTGQTPDDAQRVILNYIFIPAIKVSKGLYKAYKKGFLMNDKGDLITQLKMVCGGDWEVFKDGGYWYFTQVV